MTAALGRLLDGRDGRATAVVERGRTCDHATLRARSTALARALDDAGIGPGDRVIVALANGIDFLASLFGIWRRGAVAVPLDHLAPGARVAAIVDDCGAVALIADEAGRQRLREHVAQSDTTAGAQAPASHRGTARGLRAIFVQGLVTTDREGEPAGASASDQPSVRGLEQAFATQDPLREVVVTPEAMALLAYTSGSTGRPKGIVHSSVSLASGLAFTVEVEGIHPGDAVLVPVPMIHLFALRVALTYLVFGGPVIAARDLMDGLQFLAEGSSAGGRPTDVPPATALILVPTAAGLVVDRFADVLRAATSLRRLSIGAGAASDALLERTRAALPGLAIHLPYGLTEARVGFVEPVAGRSERHIARINPDVTLAVVDDQGHAVDRGVGEVVLSGPGVSPGLWHGDADRRDLLAQRTARDGLRTGDLVAIDDQGRRFLVGRKDDVIDVGGEKVFPAEVEAVLLAHPHIVDARVHGRPDPTGVRARVVAATVVLRDPSAATAADVLAHCRARLERYKVPQTVEFADTLPRTSTGKLVHANAAR